MLPHGGRHSAGLSRKEEDDGIALMVRSSLLVLPVDVSGGHVGGGGNERASDGGSTSGI